MQCALYRRERKKGGPFFWRHRELHCTSPSSRIRKKKKIFERTREGRKGSYPLKQGSFVLPHPAKYRKRRRASSTKRKKKGSEPCSTRRLVKTATPPDERALAWLLTRRRRKYYRSAAGKLFGLRLCGERGRVILPEKGRKAVACHNPAANIPPNRPRCRAGQAESEKMTGKTC